MSSGHLCRQNLINAGYGMPLIIQLTRYSPMGSLKNKSAILSVEAPVWQGAKT